MFASREARRFTTAMRKAGERIAIEIDGATYHYRAVVQNAGKNFMRKYDDEEREKRDLGYNLKRDKIAFIPYFHRWDDDGDITVVYRGKRYTVIADSVMNFGDKPVYIWALLREVSKQNDRYYRNIEK